MNKEQSVTLLRINKRKQVAVLAGLGFSATNDMRASLFPSYIRWSGGLLDLTVACIRISDGQRFYFTATEWQALDNQTKANLGKIGIRVRAMQQSFIIAPESIGAKEYGGNLNVTAVTDWSETGANNPFWSEENALTVTQTINTAYGTTTRNNIVGAPAAREALAYHSLRQSVDGIDDGCDWCLPLVRHAYVMFRYKTEINALFRLAWSSSNELTNVTHWCCQEASTNNAWAVNFSAGQVNVPTKITAYNVRAITLLDT